MLAKIIAIVSLDLMGLGAGSGLGTSKELDRVRTLLFSTALDSRCSYHGKAFKLFQPINVHTGRYCEQFEIDFMLQLLIACF